MGIEGGKRGVSLRVYAILFYEFIYFNYGLCLVYLVYESDKLDVLSSFFQTEPIIVKLNFPAGE